MKTIKKNIDNKFQISLERNSSMEDLNEWNNLVMNNLFLLKGLKVCLITIDPQPYSIGYELDNFQVIKRLKKDYLINWDIVLSEDFLQSIATSEELERGLILIVLSENIKDIFNIVDSVNSDGSINFDKLDTEIIVLEDDGETFIWNYPRKEVQASLANL